MATDITADVRLLVFETGGTLDLITADGEVGATIPIPPGLHRARPYFKLLAPGQSLEAVEGVAVISPRRRVGIHAYGPGATDSGANPDYRPTSASRLEREMRVTLNRMKAATSRVEAREKALAKIERVPKAKPAAPVEVIEKEPVDDQLEKADEQ